ncbi:unnamed protein product [Enterobius vermicularis]|uniref:Col_cuticle_N domain-containing protein n=1 Tax=Enterobius vermicularis TaxID=51028 RepID=A0A0N4VH04_ENTVE|nr:unnamed protein product [Enterobius vermicularis]
MILVPSAAAAAAATAAATAAAPADANQIYCFFSVLFFKWRIRYYYISESPPQPLLSANTAAAIATITAATIAAVICLLIIAVNLALSHATAAQTAQRDWGE